MPKGNKSSVTKQLKNGLAHPGTLVMPLISTGSSTGSSPTSAKTLKTPADEGIAFFESDAQKGEPPIRVYELALEADGGPSKEIAASAISN